MTKTAKRHLVQQMLQDAARVEATGRSAALRVAAMAQRSAFTALRLGRDPVAYAVAELERAQPLFVGCMVAAHLVGRRRSVLIARDAGVTRGRVTVSLAVSDAYHRAVDQLEARLRLRPHDVKRLEATYSTEAARVLKGATSKVEQKLTRVMADVTKSNLHVRGGVEELRKAFLDLGLRPDNSYTIENLFRTQTQMAYGAGRWNGDQDPLIQGELRGYEYVTAGDDRVRPTHQALEGVKAPANDPIWRRIWPPNGYSCRCQTLGVWEDFDPVYPPDEAVVDGERVIPGPDEGFDFNAGEVYKDFLEVAA